MAKAKQPATGNGMPEDAGTPEGALEYIVKPDEMSSIVNGNDVLYLGKGVVSVTVKLRGD